MRIFIPRKGNEEIFLDIEANSNLGLPFLYLISDSARTDVIKCGDELEPIISLEIPDYGVIDENTVIPLVGMRTSEDNRNKIAQFLTTVTAHNGFNGFFVSTSSNPNTPVAVYYTKDIEKFLTYEEDVKTNLFAFNGDN